MLAVAWLFVIACSGIGLGHVVRRAARSSGPLATTAGVGLGALVFVGGVLNLARVAFAPVLCAVVAAGAIACVVSFRGVRRPKLVDRAARVELLLAAAVILLPAAFAIATQFPPRAFNFHDDLQKYLAHPVRMLATGTLAGNPLSALGFDTLGGQAFLHGIVLAVSPLGYVNGVDAVLGLALLCALGASAGWRRLPYAGAAVAPVLIVAMNPQYVNVSALYVGAALVATAVLLVADDREAAAPAPLALGLVYAAAIAAKSTFALFVALHLPFSAIAVARRGASWRAGMDWAVRVALWAAVGLAPWVLLHAPEYLRPSASATPVPGGVDGALDLLSTEPLFYGATVAHYTAAAGIGAIVLFLAIASLRGPDERRVVHVAWGLVAASAAGVASCAVLIALGPQLVGYEASVRYAIPFLLGTIAVTAGLAGSLGLAGRRWRGCVPALAALALAVAFVPSLVARWRQAADAGSILAFSSLAASERYLAFNRMAMSDDTRTHVRSLQRRVPEGEPLLAWITMPFHLDHRRNRIYDVDAAGLNPSWGAVPVDARYLLWQYAGFGVRTARDLSLRMRGPGARERQGSARTLELMARLQRLSASGETVYDDGTFALVRLGSGEDR